MSRLALLIALAASASDASPGTAIHVDIQKHLLGPMHLVGIHSPMTGPHKAKRFTFAEDGWVTGLRARVVDTKGQPADSRYFCHLTFQLPPVDDPNHDRLTIDEGYPDIRLPEGYGFPVKKGEIYRVNGMLQSNEENTDKSLGIEFSVDFVPRSSGPLKDLEHLSRRVKPTGDEQALYVPTHDGVWWVPPKTMKRYSRGFQAPDSRVHYMMFHVHRFARAVSIVRSDTNEKIYGARVLGDKHDHLLPMPVFSSHEGLPLKAGVPYRLVVIYDNPTDKPIVAMAAVHFYLHRKQPASN